MSTIERILTTDAPPASAPSERTWGLSTLCGAALITAAIAWSYWDPLVSLFGRWSTEADYSHGFLVPVFSAYLLWFRRLLMPKATVRGSWLGLALLLSAALMQWMSIFFVYPLANAASLLPCLAGVTLLFGGWAALHWAWPSIIYLGFMIPIPSALAGLFSHPLQRVATIASTWLLQLFGIPAVSQGNVIWLTSGRIGVVEACSGLRMLMLFLAITVGASFLIKRPLWEKIFVGMSALVIGVITNIIRITVTAILYEFSSKELAEAVFHDLAGWFMMPVATVLLWAELFLLSKVLVSPVQQRPVIVSR